MFFSDAQADPETGDYSGFGQFLSRAVAYGRLPELIVFGGDTVNDGGDINEWRDFKRAVGESIDGAITASVAGNHDSYALLVEQFDYPQKAPETPAGGYFYTFSMGNVFFIMLDSSIMGAGNQADVDWLRSEMDSEEARSADWRIIVMHHPMWPVAENPRDLQRAETMRERFLPVLEEGGAELILCGHQHVYSRTHPMRGSSVSATGSGIVQIMSVSGDKSYYASGALGYLAASSADRNYLLLIADAESITITAYNEDGNIIDRYTLTK